MKQGILIRLASLLLVGVVALPSAFGADASKHPPDLADVAQGTYFGDVISDSQGASQSGVTVTVTRIGKNRVQITSDYARLPKGHLEKPRFLGRLMMQLPDLTKADFSNLRFFEVP